MSKKISYFEYRSDGWFVTNKEPHQKSERSHQRDFCTTNQEDAVTTYANTTSNSETIKLNDR